MIKSRNPLSKYYFASQFSILADNVPQIYPASKL